MPQIQVFPEHYLKHGRDMKAFINWNYLISATCGSGTSLLSVAVLTLCIHRHIYILITMSHSFLKHYA